MLFPISVPAHVNFVEESSVCKELFEPVNLLITIFTILMFCFAAVIMFWFIVSEQILRLIKDKINIIILMANSNKKIGKDILSSVNNIEVDSNKTAEIREQRIVNNYQKLVEQIFPVFYVLFGLLGIVIIYIIYKKIKLNGYDRISILLAFISGLPDFIFLITMGTKWKFIGDTNIYSLILDHYIKNKILETDDNAYNSPLKTQALETLQDIRDTLNSTMTVLLERETSLINEINNCSMTYIIIIIIALIILTLYLIKKSNIIRVELISVMITCFVIIASMLAFVLLIKNYAYNFSYNTIEEITEIVVDSLKNGIVV
jgi:hypothetical protein